MDLSMVQNDDYFSTSQTATMAFTYASAVSTPASTTVLKAKNANIVDDETKEIISDITGTRTDSEIQQHKLEMDRLIEQQKQEQAASQAIMAAQQLEIQRLTEAYQRANIAYEEVTAELRQQRIHVNTIITEQLSLADKKRNEEMDSLRYEMMKTMKEMLQNTQHSNNRPYGTNNSQIKRSQHDARYNGGPQKHL
jgi:ribosomal protein L20